MHSTAIQTQFLTRRFKDRLAVDAVNLMVPSSGVYGFLGPNGAGKTTTIRMLLGLLRPDAGGIRLFDTSLTDNRQRLLRQVGALVETPSLYPHLTGRENLEVTRRLLGVASSLIDRALEVVRLTVDAHRRVREYSQGMRQRLGLALALLNQPKLLILDEPTNGLDPAGIHEMRDLLRHLPTDLGITVFLSSHLLSEVEQIANHIGIIHAGRLLFQGTLAQLQEREQAQLVIGVTAPEQATRCLQNAGWAVQRRDDGMLIVGAAASAQAAQVNQLLVSQGIEVFHLARTQLSLEDIFLTLTDGKAGEGNAL